jgi:putative restriction endonuclease
MKLYVAVTDNDWYRFLAARPGLDEVNFWKPGGSGTFRALSPGEPFLFKLHAPENFIVGGGFFTHWSRPAPCSLVWRAFEEKNGAASLAEMRTRIAKYRRSTDSREDYAVGSIILSDPFFFPRETWIPAPKDFHLSTQVGKGYDLASGTGMALWNEVLLRRKSVRLDRIALPETPMYGEPTLARRRLGQGAFQLLVQDIYERRCAMTGEKVIHVLEAAHIRPVSEQGTHRIDNGLLLRSDVHTLFDRGYITVTPDYRMKVSQRLKADFDNGEEYLRLRDQIIRSPRNETDRPGKEFLEWHADTKFLG